MKKTQKYIFIAFLATILIFSNFIACAQDGAHSFLPEKRTLLDAHNCYPYHDKWQDRIERALSCGVPIAIEQDLVWYMDSLSGKSWSIVSHGKPYSGNEPTLRDYFFERIRPLIEKALVSGKNKSWPLITLNLDFKTNEPEHHLAVWSLLGEYENWLCTAERVKYENEIQQLHIKPVLVLTGSNEVQKQTFFKKVKIGEMLRIFGAIQTAVNSVEFPPEKIALHGATNYRRWWNNSWSVIEKNRFSNTWSEKENARLQAMVNHAHKLGLWIRFYTLNGYDVGESNGWGSGYNFGSKKRVEKRWHAAIKAGVDFLATDQYELFSDYLKMLQKK